MPATPESKARTRAFARVIGPWLAIAPGIIVVRTPDMGVLAATFFENPCSHGLPEPCCCSADC